MSLTFHISGDMKTAELVGKQNKKLKYELQFTKSQNEKLKRDLEYQRRELVKRVKELGEQNSQAIFLWNTVFFYFFNEPLVVIVWVGKCRMN